MDVDLTRRAGGAYPCALHAIGHDGRPYHVEILQPPGFAADGLDAKTVLDKFASLTESHVTPGHVSPDRRDRIVDAVMALDRAPSCASLMSLLAAAAS
jgi:hypothetical protein